MMLNSVNNNQPTFGMAFKAPLTEQGKEALVKNFNLANKNPIRRWVQNRAYKSFLRSQAENPVDIICIDGTKLSVSGKVFYIKAAKPAKNAMQKIGRGIRTAWNVLFNPKGELPTAMIEAGKHANKVNKDNITRTIENAENTIRSLKAANKAQQMQADAELEAHIKSIRNGLPRL